MCELCELCEQLTNTPIWGNCKYATTTIFFVLNCIFFGFRAFYLFFIQIFAVILHRNSKSSHVHRTLIALPSHTRTRVVAMRRSSSAKERSKYKQDFSRLNKIYSLTSNFVKFCLILFFIKNQPVYFVLKIHGKVQAYTPPHQ